MQSIYIATANDTETELFLLIQHSVFCLVKAESPLKQGGGLLSEIVSKVTSLHGRGDWIFRWASVCLRFARRNLSPALPGREKTVHRTVFLRGYVRNLDQKKSFAFQR